MIVKWMSRWWSEIWLSRSSQKGYVVQISNLLLSHMTQMNFLDANSLKLCRVAAEEGKKDSESVMIEIRPQESRLYLKRIDDFMDQH